MIVYFRKPAGTLYAVGLRGPLSDADVSKLNWLFGGAERQDTPSVAGYFLGPRREMVTPWSTNAVEITQNMGVSGINRIEQLLPVSGPEVPHDRMLEVIYQRPGQDLFKVDVEPQPVVSITDIAAYNIQEGLALSEEEVAYLENVSRELGRPLTDSEVFGFSQVNSEHCRHKIFNGTFIIDGEQMPTTLFQLIKKTAQVNPGILVSAYKDNVAFIQGPVVEQFAPERQDRPALFGITETESVLSLKAETHNFPTTVEPFNGAATGSGGEIRDRLAGGRGSLPLAGTAVYMTSYPRLDGTAIDKPWESSIPERPWLYQSPAQILVKASDGASDFGNKFGQPLINGSLLTFEHSENGRDLGFDKVIMLAGGIGYGKSSDSRKGHLQPGDAIVLLGGDNYRIGMGGGAVSSVGTGVYGNAIELNAIQRSNPEMQKRVMNAIRAMAESEENPIVSIHDHGAGGHLNCFSELLEETGGCIDIERLPVGDPTLSDKEIISNESQERMGIAIRQDKLDLLCQVAERERAPMAVAGEATGDGRFVFKHGSAKPVDLKLSHLFGSSPKTVLTDQTAEARFEELQWSESDFKKYLRQVLRLESVACKDWLTNKVDRSVTGKVATQQTCGKIQLPLNNLGVMALDFVSLKGLATALGHAPVAALVDAASGSRLAVSEALLNLVWTPAAHGLKGVSLSANWMWPAKTSGENARLYRAVEALSEWCCALGVNVPTGKDSLSMTQKYPDGKVVVSPGTVIVTAVTESADITKTVSPALQPQPGSVILHVDFSDGSRDLGGSTFAQILGRIGNRVADAAGAEYFMRAWDAVQDLIRNRSVLAGHDVSSGGLITSLLEMCFPTPGVGMELKFETNGSTVTELFSEAPGLVLQIRAEHQAEITDRLQSSGVRHRVLGIVTGTRMLKVNADITLEIDACRADWFETSARLDALQRNAGHARLREQNYGQQPLEYVFPDSFDGQFTSAGVDPARRERTGLRAAIIREKGVNGDREMAYALHLAGFDVLDVHMTDLIAGREDLSGVNMIVFVGGFSNSDVLGSAKGWAGAFLYNPKAKAALEAFYCRPDTLSLGVCNGCQLMMELGLVFPELGDRHPRMQHNASGRFESAFITVDIPQSNSVMLRPLEGTRLGVWLAHGEGRFSFDGIPGIVPAARYSYSGYPGNPNGSEQDAAAVCSADGRHLAIMPHLERSLFPWNWPWYPHGPVHQVSPWIQAFKAAVDWVKEHQKD